MYFFKNVWLVVEQTGFKIQNAVISERFNLVLQYQEKVEFGFNEGEVDA